jgi:hypothetical protein
VYPHRDDDSAQELNFDACDSANPAAVRSYGRDTLALCQGQARTIPEGKTSPSGLCAKLTGSLRQRDIEVDCRQRDRLQRGFRIGVTGAALDKLCDNFRIVDGGKQRIR